jgi:hypothetical protein
MANLNTKTLAAGVGDILAVDGGIDSSTARQILSGDGDVSPIYLTQSRVGIGADTPTELLHLKSSTSAKPILRIENANTDALPPYINLVKSTTDRADDDFLGVVGFKGRNSEQEEIEYAFISAQSTDISDGTEDGVINFGTMKNASGSGSAASINMVLNGANLGIGTTAPSEMLHLQSSGTTDPTIRIENTNNDTNSPNIVFMKNPGDNQEADDDVLGTIRFNGQDDGDVETEYATIYAQSKDVTGATEDGGLVFRTLNNASLYNSMIIHGANIGLGTDPSHRMHMYGNGATQSYFISTSNLNNGESSRYYASGGGNSVTRYAEFGVHYNSSSTSGNPCGYVRLDTGNNSPNYLWVDDSGNFRISSASAHIGTTNGTVVGAQTSDENLKNISSDAFPYGLTEINKLKPIKFAYKSNSSVNKLGFGAQTTQSILPETVIDSKELLDGYEMEKDSDGNETNQKAKTDKTDTILSMEYIQIVPVLVKAVQELSAKVTALENA